MPRRIAYFINSYPAVSHAFIRREILALERMGFEVQRIALRGWDNRVVDPADEAERGRTRYVLQGGLGGLLGAVLRTLLTRPGRFLAALKLACRLGWRGDRPLPYHLIYLAEACRILPWMEDFGATHVHAHFGTNSTEIVQLAHALGGPGYSFTVHGPTEFDSPLALRLGDKARDSAFVVAITSFCRSQLYRWVDPAHWDKVKVVRCGLEPAYFDAPAVPVPATARLVCPGRIAEQKGQLLLVQAAHQVIRRGLPFELVLMGDGPMRAQVEALVRSLGIEAHVRLTGAYSAEDLRRELLSARALVMPSFAEGLPMVFMEAFGLRRPVVTTQIAGHAELVRPGENGWLFPAGSVDAIADAIAECLRCPPETLTAMGEAGHALARQWHNADTEARRLAKLIGSSAAAPA